jgi:hypothetical protein
VHTTSFLAFKIPDFFVWVTMVSFLLSFVDLKNEGLMTLGVNVFNVMVVLYFFQGLAIMEWMMNLFKMGFFMRLLTYLIVVGQLFFLLSAVGFIDFWVDFRQRFSNWKTAEKSNS